MKKTYLKGNIKVSEDDIATLVEVSFWALSLAAAHTANGQSVLVHKPLIAPLKCSSEEEAYQFGAEHCEGLWPESEGWTWRVEIVPIVLGFGL